MMRLHEGQEKLMASSTELGTCRDGLGAEVGFKGARGEALLHKPDIHHNTQQNYVQNSMRDVLICQLTNALQCTSRVHQTRVADGLLRCTVEHLCGALGLLFSLSCRMHLSTEGPACALKTIITQQPQTQDKQTLSQQAHHTAHSTLSNPGCQPMRWIVQWPSIRFVYVRHASSRLLSTYATT